MSKWIDTMRMLMGIVPFVIEIIKAVEGPGNGAQKFETVSSIVLAALDVLPDEVKKAISVDLLKAFLGKVISAVVALFNLTGVFRRQIPAL